VIACCASSMLPALSDDLTTTVVDVYSRHFRDIAAYRRFDPLYDGEQL
jgi:hypothetical protein